MRCTIFCLSLAVCAFQPVFAEYGDADHTENCEVKMKPITKHAKNVLKDEHQKSINTESKHCRNVCLYESSEAFKKHYDESYTQMGTCCSKKLENNNILNDDCCDQAVVALNKLVKADVATAQACMTKCDQSGADCGKKNENQHADGRKKIKNEGSQAEANQNMLTYATGPESKL